MTRTSVRMGTAVAGVLLSLLAGGCTDGDEAPVPPPPESVEPSPSTAPTLTVSSSPLNIQLGPVRGELRPVARTQLRDRLRRVISVWMATGYVGGDFPRTDYSQAFMTYTPGVAAQAQRQRKVTTTAGLGAELAQVVPTRRVARVSVLAVRGRAIGASARVLLVMVGVRADGTELELVVRGRLRLTPTADGWRIFGFELSRSLGAPGSFAQALRDSRRRDDNRGSVQ